MISRPIKIKNVTGLHLRPAGIFCKEAIKYRSRVLFHYNGGEYNAKSVLSVLGACVKCGDEITLIIEGEDEKDAEKSIVELIESGLGE
jgi:phosphocarrier protein